MNLSHHQHYQHDQWLYLGLPVQHWLAGYRHIYFAAVLYFLPEFIDENRLSRPAPADTIPTVGLPAELIKYPQTFDPCCPLFTGENVPNFGPNFDPSRLRTAVFLNWGALSENNKNSSRNDDSSTIIPNLGWVGPQLSEPLAQWVPQRVKIKKILIYPPF